MPRIKKSKPQPHVVVVDTNVLWHKDKGPAVSPAFDAFWEKFAKSFELELRIPATVRGELLFQQTTSAHKMLEKVDEHVADIAQVADHPVRHQIKREVIAERITKKLDRWAQRTGALVLPTPVATIDWTSLCDAAVWRRPPFTSDAKNPDNEKGFRDALIMETVADFVRKDSRAVKIAFLCNDHLLRSTTAAALKGDSRFACYESLDAFASYLNLTKQKLTDQFIKAILRRATEKFYTSGDPTCLLLRERLLTKLAERDADTLKNPSESSSTTYVATGMSFTTWERASENRWFLGTTEYVSLSGERDYHWKTPLMVVVRYSGRDTLSPGQPPEEHELRLRTDVKWKARVRDDARFHDVTVEELLPADVWFGPVGSEPGHMIANQTA